MRIINIERIIDAGTFSNSAEWRTIEQQITEAILSIQWPPNSRSFTLYDEKHGNGVKPIKDDCMQHLRNQYGWALESPCNITETDRYGNFDATTRVEDKFVCVEWETGNISSSHRSVNKMAFGLQKNILRGAVLILPTRAMYNYLTDRVGNYDELAPYFPFWQSLRPTIVNGLLVVFVIEHDAVSRDVPNIPKGTDGRALA